MCKMKKKKKNVQNEEEKKEKCKIKKSVLTMPESCWDRCMTTQREELPNSLKTLMSGSLEASFSTIISSISASTWDTLLALRRRRASLASSGESWLMARGRRGGGRAG